MKNTGHWSQGPRGPEFSSLTRGLGPLPASRALSVPTPVRARTLTVVPRWIPCPLQARLRRLKRQVPGSITTPGRQLPRLRWKLTATGPVTGVLASPHHVSSADAGLSSRSPQLAQPTQVCPRDPRSYSGQERSFSRGLTLNPQLFPWPMQPEIEGILPGVGHQHPQSFETLYRRASRLGDRIIIKIIIVTSPF